jgi:RsiW-degrading membrane proteinase PrsW (M82 family)
VTTLQFVSASVLAVALPVVALLIIYKRDLYASRTFHLVTLSFAWGGIGGFGLAYVFNTYVAVSLIQDQGWEKALLYVVLAPFVEEILKSLFLFYVSRRSEFTYFVDGAVYGFASGIGFSIVENFQYIMQNPWQGILIAFGRSLSVCLMHGTASALVGAAIGRFRFQKRSGRGLALLGGWGAAITLHAFFNIPEVDRIRDLLGEGWIVPLQVGIGFVGLVLIIFFVVLGLLEQRQWFAETLDSRVGVTRAEAQATQIYGDDDLDEILEPIAKQFPNQTKQLSALLLLQAQIGIKRKVQQQLDDPELKKEVGVEIDRLQTEIEQLRKEIGPYLMTFVRTVFPESVSDFWGRLEALAVSSGPADVKRWEAMLGKKDTPRRSVFSRLQEE